MKIPRIPRFIISWLAILVAVGLLGYASFRHCVSACLKANIAPTEARCEWVCEHDQTWMNH